MCAVGGDYFFPEQRHIQHHADDSEDQSVNSHGGRCDPNRDEEMKSFRISPRGLIHMLACYPRG